MRMPTQKCPLPSPPLSLHLKFQMLAAAARDGRAVAGGTDERAEGGQAGHDAAGKQWSLQSSRGEKKREKLSLAGRGRAAADGPEEIPGDGGAWRRAFEKMAK